MKPTVQELPADLSSLLRRYQGEVWCYLRVLGCEPVQADDLTQETFLSIATGAFEYRDPGSTRAYLRKVAKNLFLGEVRASRCRPQFTDLERVEAVYERTMRQGDYLESLKECLDNLSSPRARAVVEWRYRAGATSARISRALGIKEAHVNTILHRVKRVLRRCIEGSLRA